METVELTVIEAKIAEYVLRKKNKVITVTVLHPQIPLQFQFISLSKAYWAYEYILEQERNDAT